MIRANATIAFYPAVSIGDDIALLPIGCTDANRAAPIATLHGLRQQSDKEVDQPHYCLSDFVAPITSGKIDYVGLFAVTAGLNVDSLVQKYKADNDDYSVIMVESLADRLAEVGD